MVGPELLCDSFEQILNLSASPSAEACWWETGTYKAFVLSFWAFVSSVEGEEEAGHLGNSLPLLPSYGLSSLSVYHESA